MTFILIAERNSQTGLVNIRYEASVGTSQMEIIGYCEFLKDYYRGSIANAFVIEISISEKTMLEKHQFKKGMGNFRVEEVIGNFEQSQKELVKLKLGATKNG